MATTASSFVKYIVFNFGEEAHQHIRLLMIAPSLCGDEGRLVASGASLTDQGHVRFKARTAQKWALDV